MYGVEYPVLGVDGALSGAMSVLQRERALLLGVRRSSRWAIMVCSALSLFIACWAICLLGSAPGRRRHCVSIQRVEKQDTQS